jgi:hypothetical protein
MTERDEKGEESGRPPDLRLIRLLCRRTGEQIEPAEHERCPYCFGRLADVEKGKHEAFCDYREGVDPVHFGFPDEEPRFGQG